MEIFRAAVFKIASLDRLRTLNPERVSQIEHRLAHISSCFSTPSHPPYHAMILRAIAELNEEEGASEEEISRFIVSEYDSLPWAHLRYLTHHLFKLCESGEVLSNGSGLYLIPNAVHGSAFRSRRKPRKRRIRHKVEEDGEDTDNLGKKNPVLDIVVRADDQQGEVMGNKKDGSFGELNFVLVCGLPVMNSIVRSNLNPPKLALPSPVAHEHRQIEESLASDDPIGEKPLGFSGVEGQLGFSGLQNQIEETLPSAHIVGEKPLGFSGATDSANMEGGDGSDVHGHVMNSLTGFDETELGFHPRPLQVVKMENHCDSGKITENGVPLLCGLNGNHSVQAPRRSPRIRPPKQEAAEDVVLLVDWTGCRSLQPTLPKRGRGRPARGRGRSGKM